MTSRKLSASWKIYSRKVKGNYSFIAEVDLVRKKREKFLSIFGGSNINN